MADRQLVLHSGAEGQLILRHADPEKEEAERKKRIEDVRLHGNHHQQW